MGNASLIAGLELGQASHIPSPMVLWAWSDIAVYLAVVAVVWFLVNFILRMQDD